jgi:hypothetical protein
MINFDLRLPINMPLNGYQLIRVYYGRTHGRIDQLN